MAVHLKRTFHLCLAAVLVIFGLWMTFLPSSSVLEYTTRLCQQVGLHTTAGLVPPTPRTYRSNFLDPAGDNKTENATWTEHDRTLVHLEGASFQAGYRWLRRDPVVQETQQTIQDRNSSAGGDGSSSSGGGGHVICVPRPGRLGNLMFVYASSFGLARKLGMGVVLQKSNGLLSIFNVTASVAEKPPCSRAYFIPSCCKFYPEVFQLDSRENFTFGAYAQSWKYFAHVREEVQREFSFLDGVREEAKAKITAAVLESTRPCRKHRPCTLVGVHVRRGDMVKAANFIRYGYVTAPKLYLTAALSYIRAREQNPLFLLATDDAPWALANVRDKDVVHLRGNSPAVDMAILSMCTRVVMTVGSFGWWSAYLSGGQTIYFRYWSRPGSGLYNGTADSLPDYFPPHWISL